MYRLKIRTGIGLLLLVLLNAASAAAQCVDYRDYLHASDVYELPGQTVAVARYEGFFQDYLVTANQEYGVHIFDVTDPVHPVLVGSTTSFGSAEDVVCDFIYAYLAGGGYGLVVLSIGAPDNPSQQAALSLPGIAYGIAKAGQYVFIASGNEGLHVVDVSQLGFPGPQLVAHLPLGQDLRAITIQGDIAYLCDAGGSNGLFMVDVSDPLNPALLGGINVAGNERDVAVADDVAYLAISGTTSDVAVIDVSDPASPTLIGQLDHQSDGYGITLDGNTAYVAMGLYGLRLLDITNPTEPVSGPKVETAEWALDALPFGEAIYLADGTGGLQPVGAPVLEPVPSLGSVPTADDPRGLAVNGNLALTVHYNAGLKVVDFSDPTAPFVAGSWGPSWLTDVESANGLAYIAEPGYGLRIVDITNPASPALIGSLAIPGWSLRLAHWGNYVYMGETSAPALQIVDVSDPQQPVIAGTYPLAEIEEINGIAAADGHVYFTSYSYGFKVLDVHDPANPILVAERSQVVYPGHLDLAGNRVYISLPEEVLIYDVSVPGSPVSLGSFETPGSPYRIAAAGDLAYVGTGRPCVRAYDVTGTNQVTAVGGVENTFAVHHVVLAGNLLVFLDTDGNLYCAPTHCTGVTSVTGPATLTPEAGGLRIAAFPNPFNPRTEISFSVDRPGRLRLGVYDLRGRRLASLADQHYPAGRHAVRWDGRDGAGRDLASGVYFARAETQRRVATEKLFLVR